MESVCSMCTAARSCKYCSILFFDKGVPFVFRLWSRACVTREDEETSHCLHLPAAPGTGEAVPPEQVPVPAEEVRGRHIAYAHRDTGKSSLFYKI